MSRAVNLEGFNPSTEERAALRAFLKDVKRLSPSQATIEIGASKNEIGFHTDVIIRSFHGTFEAEAKGNDLKTTLLDLIEKADTQLMEWKSKRFPKEGVERVPS